MGELTLLMIIAQAIGFIGWFFYCKAAYKRCRKNLFVYECIGASIIGVQYVLLGSLVGMFVNVIYAGMALSARLNPDLKVSQRALFVFIALFALSFYISWTGDLTDYLAVFATSIGLLGRSFKSDLLLRKLSLLSALGWIAFAVTTMSWAGIIFCSFYGFGHLKAIIEHYSKRRFVGLPQKA